MVQGSTCVVVLRRTRAIKNVFLKKITNRKVDFLWFFFLFFFQCETGNGEDFVQQNSLVLSRQRVLNRTLKRFAECGCRLGKLGPDAHWWRKITRLIILKCFSNVQMLKYYNVFVLILNISNHLVTATLDSIQCIRNRRQLWSSLGRSINNIYRL